MILTDFYAILINTLISSFFLEIDTCTVQLDQESMFWVCVLKGLQQFMKKT